jgi:hypothetical protein
VSRPNVAILMAVFALTSGVGEASTPPGQGGFCAALESFASAEPRGLERQAHFFWPVESPSEDGSIDVHFYAAMAAKPMDEAARRMQAAYGRATHYIPLVKLKKSFDECRSVRKGLVKVEASAMACDGYQSTQPCLSIRRPARP